MIRGSEAFFFSRDYICTPDVGVSNGTERISCARARRAGRTRPRAGRGARRGAGPRSRAVPAEKAKDGETRPTHPRTLYCVSTFDFGEPRHRSTPTVRMRTKVDSLTDTVRPQYTTQWRPWIGQGAASVLPRARLCAASTRFAMTPIGTCAPSATHMRVITCVVKVHPLTQRTSPFMRTRAHA